MSCFFTIVSKELLRASSSTQVVLRIPVSFLLNIGMPSCRLLEDYPEGTLVSLNTSLQPSSISLGIMGPHLVANLPGPGKSLRPLTSFSALEKVLSL